MLAVLKIEQEEKLRIKNASPVEIIFNVSNYHFFFSLIRQGEKKTDSLYDRWPKVEDLRKLGKQLFNLEDVDDRDIM
jgi:hypothetical protein